MNSASAQLAVEPTAQRLAAEYRSVRAFTERICEPLSAEDCAAQSMPDVSPTRWHLAHTTWFFETFVLGRLSDYRVYHPQYSYLFNSYYNTVGAQFPRLRRGLLTRPGLSEIQSYRRHVDARMLRALEDETLEAALLPVVELGLHHEQQHQELMLTDIKHVLWSNPLLPEYREGEIPRQENTPPLEWLDFDEGIRWIGHSGDGFAYDNESPRHRVFLEAFRLASRPVTCGEYLEFIEDGGYHRPELWLSEGWNRVRECAWEAPLYWLRCQGAWRVFTLAGPKPLEPTLPVCHVSYFEADAFATWAGARLPTEAEWEVAAEVLPIEGHFVDRLFDEGLPIHPHAARAERPNPIQMYGDVWQWTGSAYSPYPRYKPAAGALGEYNGKFMCNQYVLRGGSCASRQGHLRPSYRNFFPPDARWQFSGIRLAGP